jgi:hypothetical protein
MRLRSTDEGWDELKAAYYLSTNTVDPGFDLTGEAEFGDAKLSDNYMGLTIIEFSSIRATRIWLNGYRV